MEIEAQLFEEEISYLVEWYEKNLIMQQFQRCMVLIRQRRSLRILHQRFIRHRRLHLRRLLQFI